MDNRVPDPLVIGELVKAGLASTNNGHGFKYGPTWGPARMIQLLRTSLPRVFQEFTLESPWLSTLGVDARADKEVLSYTLPFILLFHRYSKFSIVDETVLNGDAFHRIRAKKSTVSETTFWIGTSALAAEVV